jgi:hypothetical protein
MDMKALPIAMLALDCPFNRRTQFNLHRFHWNIRPTGPGSSNFLEVESADVGGGAPKLWARPEETRA